MLRIIYYISAIILLSGCVNKSIKSGDGANTASIADINASIRVDFSKGVKNKIIYQPFSSFVNDSSVHIILGFLFSSTSSKKYMLRTIHFNGNSNVYRDKSKDLVSQNMVGYIYSDDMGKLDSLFFKYDFNKYPNDLPNPKKGNSQWPLSYFVIGYRENPSDKIKMVYVDQTVSGNYPDRFFEFLYKLDTGIQLYQ